MISDLIVLLTNGGFFRDIGLNHLPTVKHIADLLNRPNIFKNVSYKTIKTSTFVRNSKFSFQGHFSKVQLDANRPQSEILSPILVVQLFSTGGYHAVVLEDAKVMG